MNTASRTAFIKEFVALVRFISAGEANIGFLGKERKEIHRISGESVGVGASNALGSSGGLRMRMRYFNHRRQWRMWKRNTGAASMRWTTQIEYLLYVE